MRFLVDAQLPPALARRLTELGHVAEHVVDLGMGSAKDGAIWSYAEMANAVIVTKDADFPIRRSLVTSGPSVLWVRRGNTTRRALLEWFEPLLPSAVAAFERGEMLVEIA